MTVADPQPRSRWFLPPRGEVLMQRGADGMGGVLDQPDRGPARHAPVRLLLPGTGGPRAGGDDPAVRNLRSAGADELAAGADADQPRGDLLGGDLFITDPDLATLPKALLGFKGEFTTNYPVLFSGVIIASIPMIVAYVLLQRFFVAGITAGAVRG